MVEEVAVVTHVEGSQIDAERNAARRHQHLLPYKGGKPDEQGYQQHEAYRGSAKRMTLEPPEQMQAGKPIACVKVKEVGHDAGEVQEPDLFQRIEQVQTQCRSHQQDMEQRTVQASQPPRTIDDQHKDKEQRRQEPEENDDIIPRIEQHPDVLRK